jgi:hypothetical protein
MQDVFVDRLMNISVLQGVARLDFARVDSVDEKEKQINLSPSYRVAMPIDALESLLEQSTNALQVLKGQKNKN